MISQHAVVSAAILLLSATTSMAATVVNTFDGSQGWTASNVKNGDSQLVDLTGEGGDLENNQPLPTGAVRQTTTADTEDKSIVKLSAPGVALGTVMDIFDGDLGLSYSFYKSSGSTNVSASPALKLEFFGAHPNDGYGELVYEPYWQPNGVVGNPTPDMWLTEEVTLTKGLFWTTGMFGQPNTAGGPPLRTLAEWLATFDDEFKSASLLSIGIGIGSFNTNQTNYFDNVSVAGVSQFADGTYDFEQPAPIPVPASLPLLLAGIGGLAFLRRKRT